MDISGQVPELDRDMGVYSGGGKGWLSALVPRGQLPRQVARLGLFLDVSPCCQPQCEAGQGAGQALVGQVRHETSTACRASTSEGAGLVHTHTRPA